MARSFIRTDGQADSSYSFRDLIVHALIVSKQRSYGISAFIQTDGQSDRRTWLDRLGLQTDMARSTRLVTDMARSTRLVIESSLRRKGQTEGHG